MSKRFYKVMLGRKSDLAEKCRSEGFIGTDFDVHEDLTGQLPDDWREFNQKIDYFRLRSQKSQLVWPQALFGWLVKALNRATLF